MAPLKASGSRQTNRSRQSGALWFWSVAGVAIISLFMNNLIRWIRNGYPSLDGKMFIGGFFASTLDILFAIFNPTWAMNAYGFSYGSWANSIPGWPSPGAHKIPWGLLWCLPAYIWLGVGAAIFGC